MTKQVLWWGPQGSGLRRVLKSGEGAAQAWLAEKAPSQEAWIMRTVALGQHAGNEDNRHRPSWQLWVNLLDE